MKTGKAIIILLNLLILLVWFNLNVVNKEKILKDGELVLLELAPVDPRSLMQGDYMRLRYKATGDLSPHKLSKRGYCVVKVNKLHIAERVRFQPDKQPLHEGEYLIKYFYNSFFINIGAESYFFQEGMQSKYASAKYGGLKIDKDGNSILIGLYSENYRLIK